MSTTISPPGAETTTSSRRGLLWLAWLLAFAGPLSFFAMVQMHRLMTPWYVPALAGAAILFGLLAFVRRPSIVRFLVVGVLCAFAGFQLFMFWKMMLPPYQGPLVVGQPIPAFTTSLANGDSLDQAKLAGDKTSVIVFFRGRWCPVCLAELGELEKFHEEFAKRNVRVFVATLETKDLAQKSQEQFPHLTVIADTDTKLIQAINVLHKDANPSGGDSAMPTTIVVDRDGVVRWIYRGDNVLGRLAPADLLAQLDRLAK